MKARVYYRGMWFGEVYTDWLLFGECWQDVTSPCFTKTGATLALKSWLKKHTVYDVEI
jgi:hypothetical protein